MVEVQEYSVRFWHWLLGLWHWLDLHGVIGSLIAAVLASIAVAIYKLFRARAPERPTRSRVPLRSAIPAPNEATPNFANPVGGPLAFSPDGLRVAFAATPPEGMDLVWVHTLADGKARPIPNTEGASCPFWSPDGRSRLPTLLRAS